MQKKKLALAADSSTAPRPLEQRVPDLTDFMNDMFFGAANVEKKSYNLTGDELDDDEEEEEEGFDDSRRSTSSRLTKEWLEEAKLLVASSPSRCESPSRLIGSPRFAGLSQTRSSASLLDRRDPRSRSARRQRATEGFSGEILTKSAKHTRNKSEPLDEQPPPAADTSPASAVQKWFSTIIHKPPPISPPAASANPPPPLPPRQSTSRKSRFHNTQPQPILGSSRRTFRAAAGAPAPDTQVLSPPKNLVESAHRRSISSSTCSLLDKQVLSPPRNLVESAHRRSISSSTCSTENIPRKPSVNDQTKEVVNGCENRDLNGFLKEQRDNIEKILNGEIDGKAKIVLSGPSNSTSSMVAAICYAWLLDHRMKTGKEGGGFKAAAVVPVMNVRRGKMWKQRQVAWLFHHVGLDATALLFSDEVDLETLMMAKKLHILIVGQDILRRNGEVGSQCTILTDNYCEDAYDLLQSPILKKLLLAGILLDTQNLNLAGMLSTTRDTEAVQLLSVGCTPNYQSALYDQLMQDQKDGSLFEALRYNYGKPPNEGGSDSGEPIEHTGEERKSKYKAGSQNSDRSSSDMRSTKSNMALPMSAKPKSDPAQASSPAPAQAANPPRGKNKFFLAKWFGFGSK
ncbi:uncharacterized protein LOC127794860 isoform X2 [Diospyros lotus]|uniref:uncharacterized protein LOC127794860 isoform X2 n=1 Tax=Diospyros lotus TaxID=55363 RepID=UPI00225756D4|nr:uncharacterized protein LOC127794860 isoform X2 [Diospyros lotus]